MDLSGFIKQSDCIWELPARGAMRVPAIIYANETLMEKMDEKVAEQATNVATLPGIVKACYAMPDAHWGYGFPSGGVAAFDPEEGGVISAGGVGFDISCGVRTLRTGLKRHQIDAVKRVLSENLYITIPSAVGSTGRLRLKPREMDEMLRGGARWAVEHGYGESRDLERIEEHGRMAGADPAQVSEHAKKRQQDEMGSLGPGNHYLEVQEVKEIYDSRIASAYGVAEGDVLVSIHCGSRGLGQQIGSEFLREMTLEAPRHGLQLPDCELACAPINSPLGERYLGAMRAAINCALANRQILTHLVRKVFAQLFGDLQLDLIYDVSHNTCKVEHHLIDGERRKLYIHRKGATRAFGPGHPDIPEPLRPYGQPVLIGGSMGSSSYILAGAAASEQRAFSSACHGAGRAMCRHEALRRWHGSAVADDPARHGTIIRSPGFRGVAEEAPGGYNDVSAVVDAAASAGLANKVARLEPLICIKG